MSWFWCSSSPSDDDNKPKDPLRSLDPSLREFLKKESPVKYETATSQSQPIPKAQPIEQPSSKSSKSPTTSPKTTPSTTPSTDPTTSSPAVPSQSLYSDGRYAHLWKTYESQYSVENANKTDQEKINDVLEGYKYRKYEIGKAALENCAMEQWEVNDCFKNGSWGARFTLCRKENRCFERCYTMQAKFLKALGYLSTFERPSEVDEQIQMHADTLYHRMLAQEAAIESAKAANKPIPSFPPLLSSSPNSTPVPGAAHASKPENELQPSDLPVKVQAAFKKRLEGLNEGEREVEERAIKAEIQAGVEVAKNLGKVYEVQKEERRIRKEMGRETIGDKISSVFGFK
ncbi:hypothetical protein VTL71DRAFT_8042 [Oculimacula yallundae]|uniref:Uncharacterized protein n=1 Tax=Oculimacula yallundae TaxID=86028 RepID=A0ABR4CWG5_9HELO